MKTVILLGSTGFVGRHVAEKLAHSTGIKLITTTRQQEQVKDGVIYFDLLKAETWPALLACAPDVVVNSAGYGVVKEQTDLAVMYEVNYLLPMKLAQLLQQAGGLPLWLQVGTAFEYDLTEAALSEESVTLPATHYGISKLMFSTFLQSPKNKLPYYLLRPFAMFGPYESASKIVPYLINAQRTQRAIPLSSGQQQRDYFYVKDLATFAESLIKQKTSQRNEVYNLGTGRPISIRELAQELAVAVPGFNEDNWNWDQLPQRANENEVFFNASAKASRAGLTLTPRSIAIQETVNYFLENV
jgi:nucleoside-diphosphate-sugar epimerase